MPPEPVRRPASAAAGDEHRRGLSPALRLALVAGLAAFASSACTPLLSGQRPPAPEPVVNSAAANAAVLGDYLQLLQHLVQGPAAEQAEIVASAQREYQSAPTPSRELKLALVLGTPGHPAADLPKAQGLLREVMANPENLLPGERALATLELSQISDHLTLETENRRLQTDAARADHERTASANHRLQSEMDENARLRRELEEARAKLDAIAAIERSLNERKPDNAGR
jgi:hypothetical protein